MKIEEMNRVRWIIFSLILLTTAAAYYFYAQSPSAPTTARLQVGTPDVIKKHIQKLNSPVTLVNFWASWCEPCKVEFPYILEVQRQFKDRGFRVVFVSLDDPDDLTIADSFLTEQHVNDASFYRGQQPLEFVNQLFPNWSGAIPASLLLGPNLQVLDAWEGDTTIEELTQRVERQLKGS